jgi:hypothetical protein
MENLQLQDVEDIHDEALEFWSQLYNDVYVYMMVVRTYLQ